MNITCTSSLLFICYLNSGLKSIELQITKLEFCNKNTARALLYSGELQQPGRQEEALKVKIQWSCFHFSSLTLAGGVGFGIF